MAKVLSKYILIHFQVIYFNIYFHNKIYNFGNLGMDWFLSERARGRGELKPWQDEWWHSIRLIHTRVFKKNIALDKVGKF